MIGAVIAMIRGREDIVLFHYRLGKDRIFKALTITMLSLTLVIFVTIFAVDNGRSAVSENFI